jgi:hypothetical protein
MFHPYIPGYVGGSWYAHSGGAANYLCLPSDPIWAKYDDTLADGGFIYGGEFWNLNHNDDLFGKRIHDLDPTCSVCRSTSRGTSLMIPGRTECYPGWHAEYSGYLMTGYYGMAAASEYICVDGDPDTLLNSQPSHDGVHLGFVEGRCGSLPCPPYVDGRELPCVVCTK